MSEYEKSKFRFSEVFNNTDGKTSGSSFVGVFLGLAACVTFLSAVVGWFFGMNGVIEIMGKALTLAATGAGLMGVRKVSGNLQKRSENKK
jgi:hypothetical protein